MLLYLHALNEAMVLRTTFFSLLFLVLLSSSTFEDSSDTTTKFVTHKIGMSERFGILEINDTLAYLELYTKYKGDVVPLNMSWNSKLEPQIYVINREKSDSTITYYNCGSSEIRIEKKSANIKLENSFMGSIDMNMHGVDDLPTKYHHLRNHAYMFTGRNAVGFNFKKTGLGYDNYDKIMDGNLLYKDRDNMKFNNFIAKYDSVQHNIYQEIYSIQDSVIAINQQTQTEEVIQQP